MERGSPVAFRIQRSGVTDPNTHSHLARVLDDHLVGIKARSVIQTESRQPSRQGEVLERQPVCRDGQQVTPVVRRHNLGGRITAQGHVRARDGDELAARAAQIDHDGLAEVAELHGSGDRLSPVAVDGKGVGLR